MKTKKIPLRTCLISREKLEKKELIRIVRTPEKEVLIDLTGKLNGRGVYLKKDLEVFNKAQKKDVLSKALEIDVDPNIYEELKKLI